MSRIVQYSTHGGPEVLDIVEVDEPHAGPGQVRVAVRAAGINTFDFNVRQDPQLLPSHSLPSGQGNEFAGVVDEIGEGVEGIEPGLEVLGWTSFAAQADFVVVRASHVAPKPASLDWATAGGIGLVGHTANRATIAVDPKPGETVLVSAAAGGVGLFACQFAMLDGATVIGTASERHHDFLRRMGITPVAYGVGLVDRLRAVAPYGISAVIDNAGQETVEAAIELGVDPSRINSIVWYEGAEKYGISTVGGNGKTSENLAQLAELVAEGRLVMPIAATYPLAQVRQAYEHLETRHLLGKIVLTVP
jgi:enoyl reductase